MSVFEDKHSTPTTFPPHTHAMGVAFQTSGTKRLADQWPYYVSDWDSCTGWHLWYISVQNGFFLCWLLSFCWASSVQEATASWPNRYIFTNYFYFLLMTITWLRMRKTNLLHGRFWENEVLTVDKYEKSREKISDDRTALISNRFDFIVIWQIWFK